MIGVRRGGLVNGRRVGHHRLPRGRVAAVRRLTFLGADGGLWLPRCIGIGGWAATRLAT